jgi:hypothetical protein
LAFLLAASASVPEEILVVFSTGRNGSDEVDGAKATDVVVGQTLIDVLRDIRMSDRTYVKRK